MVKAFGIGLLVAVVSTLALSACETRAPVACIVDGAPSGSGDILYERDGVLPVTSNLTVRTWNIGYSGLGSKWDFVEDGGTHVLPESAAVVRENLRQIMGHLGAARVADVVFLQEVAGASIITRGVDVRGEIVRMFSDSNYCYFAGTTSRVRLGVLDVQVGSFTSSGASASMDFFYLPGVNNFGLGMLKRRFPVGVTRIGEAGAAGGARWVLFNVHLSAFDDGGLLRRRQLEALFAVAAREYAAGSHVIIGGDWNLRLTATSFAHTTSESHLFWIYDIPMEMVPSNWSVAFDPSFPTVRTLQKPYVEGENYTTIVDGFIVSPNVKVEAVYTEDLHFVASDHNPVLGVFSTVESGQPIAAHSQ